MQTHDELGRNEPGDLDDLDIEPALHPQPLNGLGRTFGQVDAHDRALGQQVAVFADDESGDGLGVVAGQVEADAKTKSGRDAMRLNALAETLKGRAAALR